MNNFLKLDWMILITTLLLLAVGLLALYSVSFNGNQLEAGHLTKQAIAAFLGIIALFALAFFDYRVLNSYSTKMYLGALIVLVAVFFFGTTVRGTTGWIGFGGFHIQPVELVKLVMIIFMASFLSKKKTELSVPVKIVASIVLVFLPVFLVVEQPDFGSSVIIIGTWLAMILVSGIDKKSLIILAVIGILSVSSGWFLLKDYQKERLQNFINPYNDPQGSGYNVIQSSVAVGSGGVWGKGLGHGSQSQLNFLPEKHTDFIFAAIAEELGLFGSAVVLVLFGVLLYKIRGVARLARDNFGYLIAVGVIVMFSLQIFINVGMNIGIAPVAGLPLPFLSYGGSSLVSSLAAIGIIQSIYIRRIKTID